MGPKYYHSLAMKMAEFLQNEAIHSKEDKELLNRISVLLKMDSHFNGTVPSASDLCSVIISMKNMSSESELTIELMHTLSQIFHQHYSDPEQPFPRPTSSEICRAISGMRNFPLKIESVQRLLHILGKLLSYTSETDKPSVEDLDLALEGVKSMPSDIKVVGETITLLRQILSSCNG